MSIAVVAGNIEVVFDNLTSNNSQSMFDDLIRIWYLQYDHRRKYGTLSPQPLCLEKHPGEVPTVGESVPAVQLTPSCIHKWRGVVSKDEKTHRKSENYTFCSQICEHLKSLDFFRHLAEIISL